MGGGPPELEGVGVAATVVAGKGDGDGSGTCVLVPTGAVAGVGVGDGTRVGVEAGEGVRGEAGVGVGVCTAVAVGVGVAGRPTVGMGVGEGAEVRVLKVPRVPGSITLPARENSVPWPSIPLTSVEISGMDKSPGASRSTVKLTSDPEISALNTGINVHPRSVPSVKLPPKD